MTTVRFNFDAVLVAVRREVAASARWDRRSRSWLMSQGDADRFLTAAHQRLWFGKMQAFITVDDARWRIGFSTGAPELVTAGDQHMSRRHSSTFASFEQGQAPRAPSSNCDRPYPG